MYCKIVYEADAGNDATQVLSDIVLLLGGETVVANITANGAVIDEGSSAIDVAVEAVAVTLYDDVSATIKVFQIPYHDDAAQFFYMELFVSGTDIDHRYWTSWNQVGNSGSGACYYPGNGSEFVSWINFATAANTLYMTVTARHCIARSVYNSGSIRYFRGYVQYDRGEAWDTPAAGYAPMVSTYNDTFAQGNMYTLPHKRSDGAVYSTTLASLYMATRYANSQLDDFNVTIGGNSSSARGLNATSDPVHNMYEFGFSYLSSGERFLTGKVADMYLATYQNGGFGDVVSILANNYIIWETDLNYRLAIRKG